MSGLTEDRVREIVLEELQCAGVVDFAAHDTSYELAVERDAKFLLEAAPRVIEFTNCERVLVRLGDSENRDAAVFAKPDERDNLVAIRFSTNRNPQVIASLIGNELKRSLEEDLHIHDSCDTSLDAVPVNIDVGISHRSSPLRSGPGAVTPDGPVSTVAEDGGDLNAATNVGAETPAAPTTDSPDRQVTQ